MLESLLLVFGFVLQVWTGSTVCGNGRHSSLPCPKGVVGGVQVGRGHCSRCFLSVRRGGPQGALDDRDERFGDPSSPPSSHLPLPDMCQSVPGQCGGPVRLPIRHVLPRQGLAVLHSTAHQHESFSPPPPAKCNGTTGINETLWINKYG